MIHSKLPCFNPSKFLPTSRLARLRLVLFLLLTFTCNQHQARTNRPTAAAASSKSRSIYAMYPTVDEKIMLEKRYGRRTPLPIHNRHRSPSNARTRRSIIIYIALICGLFLGVIYVVPSLSQYFYPQPELPVVNILPVVNPHEPYGTPSSSSSTTPSSNTTKVPLEAHIMSKCPDARDCLRDLVVPAMERVVDAVDFKLSYIGKVDDDDNIQCMHGQTECLGNMMMLCAAQLYPDNVKISLGFSTCLIMSYQKIPQRDLVQGCAMEHSVDFEKLNACISADGHGLDLLESSIERSRDAGVTKSCTVRVDGEKWCIRDGGAWKECEGGHEVSDLVEEVEKLYKKGNESDKS